MGLPPWGEKTRGTGRAISLFPEWMGDAHILHTFTEWEETGQPSVQKLRTGQTQDHISSRTSNDEQILSYVNLRLEPTVLAYAVRRAICSYVLKVRRDT